MNKNYTALTIGLVLGFAVVPFLVSNQVAVGQVAIHTRPLYQRIASTTPDKRAAMASKEIVEKVRPVARTERGDYDIEIVSIEQIGNGVAVLARVWTNVPIEVRGHEVNNGVITKPLLHTIPADTQIGFGPDGTVDIERFKINNPPILVRDANGPIVVSWDLEGVTQTRSFRQDLREALLQSIQDTLKVKREKYGDANIVPGKIGNTTSTFYSEEDVASTAGDGFLLDNNNSTYSTGRDATTAASAFNDTNNIFSGGRQQSASDWDFWRAFMSWDTSSIGSDTVSSCTASPYYDGAGTWDTQSGDIDLVSATAADPTAYVTGDWDQITFSAQDSIDVTSVSSSAYYDFTCDISDVDTSGVTQLALIDSHQVDNTQYTQNTVGSRVAWESADATAAATTNDPKLVIEHSSGGGGGGGATNYHRLITF